MSGKFFKENIMNNTLIAALIDSLESENDSLPEGYDLESTSYTITVTLQSEMVRANMLETV